MSEGDCRRTWRPWFCRIVQVHSAKGVPSFLQERQAVGPRGLRGRTRLTRRAPHGRRTNGACNIGPRKHLPFRGDELALVLPSRAILHLKRPAMTRPRLQGHNGQGLRDPRPGVQCYWLPHAPCRHYWTHSGPAVI